MSNFSTPTMQNHDLRTLPTHQHIRAACALFLGLVCAVQVNAQTAATVSGFDRFMVLTTGGTSTVSFAGNGTPLAANPISTAGPKMGRFGIAAAAATKSLALSGTADLAIGAAGRVVPVTMSGTVSAATLAQAVGVLVPLIGGWPGVALTGALGIYAWMNSAGITVDADGNPVGPVDVVSTAYTHDLEPTVPYPTYASACSAWGVKKNQFGKNAGYSLSPKTSTPCIYSIYAEPGHTYLADNGPSIDGPKTMTGVEIKPMTNQQALSALEKVQPPPKALEDLYTIDQSGRYSDKALKDLAITNVVAHGPSTVSGPESVVDTPAQNGQPATQTKTKTDYNCVFVVADVTCTDKKTVTQTSTNPTTGAQTTTTTTETAEAKPKTDTPDPCIANPKRNGCREDEFDTPSDTIPKTDKTITFQAENLGFAGGMCPNDVWLTPHGMHQQVRVINWIDNCNKITTYAKPMILALATFAALMILFAGGTRSES